MVVPVSLNMPMAAAHQGHDHAMAMSSMTPTTALLATSVHTIGYLLVTTIVAVVVFEKIGVGILRNAWFNLDLVWASTLLGRIDRRLRELGAHTFLELLGSSTASGRVNKLARFDGAAVVANWQIFSIGGISTTSGLSSARRCLHTGLQNSKARRQTVCVSDGGSYEKVNGFAICSVCRNRRDSKTWPCS
jgi:hypothetical protein